jgi:hypothetical protein
MQIKISTMPIDKIVTPALVVGLFADETPPRGITGLMDWRLNGFISWEMAQGRAGGEFGETCALALPCLQGIDLLILYGLGETRAFGLNRARESGRNITLVMAGLKRRAFAFAIPDSGGIKPSSPEVTCAFLVGCLEGQRLTAAIPGEFPTLVTVEKMVEEVRLGATLFQRQTGMEGRLSLELLGREI